MPELQKITLLGTSFTFEDGDEQGRWPLDSLPYEERHLWLEGRHYVRLWARLRLGGHWILLRFRCPIEPSPDGVLRPAERSITAQSSSAEFAFQIYRQVTPPASNGNPGFALQSGVLQVVGENNSPIIVPNMSVVSLPDLGSTDRFTQGRLGVRFPASTAAQLALQSIAFDNLPFRIVPGRGAGAFVIDLNFTRDPESRNNARLRLEPGALQLDGGVDPSTTGVPFPRLSGSGVFRLGGPVGSTNNPADIKFLAADPAAEIPLYVERRGRTNGTISNTIVAPLTLRNCGLSVRLVSVGATEAQVSAISATDLASPTPLGESTQLLCYNYGNPGGEPLTCSLKRGGIELHVRPRNAETGDPAALLLAPFDEAARQVLTRIGTDSLHGVIRRAQFFTGTDGMLVVPPSRRQSWPEAANIPEIAPHITSTLTFPLIRFTTSADAALRNRFRYPRPGETFRAENGTVPVDKITAASSYELTGNILPLPLLTFEDVLWWIKKSATSGYDEDRTARWNAHWEEDINQFFRTQFSGDVAPARHHSHVLEYAGTSGASQLQVARVFRTEIFTGLSLVTAEVPGVRDVSVVASHVLSPEDDHGPIFRIVSFFRSMRERHNRRTLTVTTLNEEGLPLPPAVATPLGIAPLLSGAVTTTNTETSVTFDPISLLRDYGPVGVDWTNPAGMLPEYLPIRASATAEHGVASLQRMGNARLEFPARTFAPFADFDQITSAPAGPLGALRGVVKLGRKRNLRDIFQELGVIDAPPAPNSPPLKELVPARLLDDPEWQGVVLLGCPLSLEPDNYAGNVLGPITGQNGTLVIGYIAIAPAPKGHRDRYSLSLRSCWTNPAALPGFQSDESQELLYRLDKYDLEIADNALSRFYIEASLQLRTAFGNKVAHSEADGLRKLTLKGNVEKKPDGLSFRMRGELDKAQAIVEDVGPIEAVSLKAIELGFDQGNSVIDIDGDLKLKRFDIAALQFEGTQEPIEFQGLRIRLPHLSGGGMGGFGGIGLGFEYPSLKIPLKLPAWNLGALALQLRGIGINFRQPAWDWGIHLQKPSGTVPRVILPLRFSLGALPSFSLFSGSGMDLDLNIGIPKGFSGPADFHVNLTGASIRDFSFNLLGFLEISAEKAEIGSGADCTFILIKDLSIKVLGKSLIQGLSAKLFFGRGNKRSFGFVVFQSGGSTGSLLQWQWILIGKNVTIQDDQNQSLLKQLMAATPAKAEEGASEEEVAVELKTQFDDNKFVPLDNLDGLRKGEWLFGASFTFLEVFQCKFLYQENAYCGIGVGGKIFDDVFGPGFAASALYIKAARREEDRFIVSVSVPRATTSAFALTGGTLLLDIAMNGSFLIDCGYPWLEGGIRKWDRAFGVIIQVIAAGGGFYLRFARFIRDTGGTSAQYYAIGGGFAMRGGLGVSTGGSFFSASASLTLYYLLEGEFFIRKGQGIVAIRLAGTSGIVGEARAHLNWWIISVDAYALIGAEARVIACWAKDTGTATNILPFVPEADQALMRRAGGGGLILRCEFNFYLVVGARACIGGGWFKICKSISITVPYSIGFDISL